MKRFHQIAVTGLLTLVFIVWLAPASLIGIVLQQASHRLWSLADVDGTLWNGRGVITGKPDKSPRQVSLPPLSWKLLGFQNGRLLFQVSANGQPVGHLQIGSSGWQANLHGLDIEARELTPLLPGILNKGEWHGLVNFRQISAQGNWQSTKISQVEVQWLNAATSLIPKGQLGSFVLKGHAESVGMSFSVTSQDGPLMISGEGKHSAQQGLQFNGELADAAGLISQSPGFLSAYLRPAGAPNHYTLQISQLNF
ncbi:type II secretion system protein N [Variovorax sp. AFSI2.2]|uniref:type II secretion system protein N n=1 Tax=Variovorax sp. AFSI2.2 TaxID=3384160 RepID=UPI003EB70099